MLCACVVCVFVCVYTGVHVDEANHGPGKLVEYMAESVRHFGTERHPT